MYYDCVTSTIYHDPIPCAGGCGFEFDPSEFIAEGMCSSCAMSTKAPCVACGRDFCREDLFGASDAEAMCVDCLCDLAQGITELSEALEAEQRHGKLSLDI